jgi:4a-hydroxytetrahydrobiopterin dehydratase
MTELLSDIAIQRELGSLNGWARRGSAIVKTYQFKTFPDAIAFVGRVAEVAEAAGHHPDIDIRYTKIVCTLSTHDSGGITQYDLDLARAMDSVQEEA